jgi:drug/metabolite transporter (DMT)-like permease
MDVLRLAILAFVAAGIVLAISGVSAVMAVIISGSVTAVVMLIAVVRNHRRPRQEPKDDIPRGPTIKP